MPTRLDRFMACAWLALALAGACNDDSTPAGHPGGQASGASAGESGPRGGAAGIDPGAQQGTATLPGAGAGGTEPASSGGAGPTGTGGGGSGPASESDAGGGTATAAGTASDASAPDAGDDAGGARCAQSCEGFGCCEGRCVNLGNDIDNCGKCGRRCSGDHPYCADGECAQEPPCTGADVLCQEGGFCCGSTCCNAGQLCCTVPGPTFTETVCVTPTESDTCPMGCVLCDCSAPDLPVATPAGERPISTLRAGDLVYSVDGAAIVAVPIALATTNPVENHRVIRLELSDGAVLEISARHPLADGRLVADLRAGDAIGESTVRSAATVDYEDSATFDILPSSSTGIYFSRGLPLASTLHSRPRGRGDPLSVVP